MFSDSRDHALTAMVIKEAHQASAQGGGFVGRTAVQKIMYFLKALDVPMKYKFRLHHYGPYSDDLRDDVDCLIADEVIRDESTNRDKFSKFVPSEQSEIPVGSYQSDFVKYKSVIQAVSQALAKLSPEQLEVLMTLDYLYRVERAKDPQSNIRERVLDRFMELKGDLKRKTMTYKREIIENWYDMMIDLKLFV